MIPPGTPALDLPAYAAPLFTAAAVPLGSVFTSVTFESTGAADQVGVPFTFGHAFKKGDLAPHDGLAGRIDGAPDLPLQFDVKATHVDGSVRHAIVSGLLPALAVAQTRVMGLKRVALTRAPVTGAVDAAGLAVVLNVGGVQYSASPAGLPGKTWIDGEIVTERIFDVPFVSATGPHPCLTAQFCVRSYHGMPVSKVDVTIEHSGAYQTNGSIQPAATATNPNPAPIPAVVDITYDVSVQVDGVERYGQLGLVHFACARWKKTFYRSATPAVHIKHNPAYLIASMQVPAYDQRVKVAEATLAQYDTWLRTLKFGPMQFGRFAPAMGTTGGRPEIGLMPDSYAATVLSMDKRAKAMMLASADAAGAWPTHRRDRSAGPAAGQPMDVLHWPRATLVGTANDAMNKLSGQSEKLPAVVSANPGQSDVSHQPAFAYLPYLLTGDFYYLEEMHFWNGFNMYQNNPAYRGNEKGWFKSNQVRGQAWALRTLAETAYITPDSHQAKAACMFWLDSNVNYYLDRYVDQKIRADGTALPAVPALADKVSSLGFLSDGYALGYNMPSLSGATTVDERTGLAPWQDDFVTQVLGRVVALGHAGAARFLRWKARFVVERMIGKGACFIDAAVYSLRVRDNTSSPLYENIEECYAKTLGAQLSALPCNSVERLAFKNSALPANQQVVGGEMTGYPSEPTGFPANMQPALAAAVDSGIPGAAEAWALYETRAKKQLYGNAPQFAIVPRPTVAAEPAPSPDPVVTPPVVTAPTPVPTPEPVPVPTVPPVVPTPVPTPPTPVPAPVGATVSLFNDRLASGEEYVVTVTKANGQILAVEFPVIAR